MIDELKMPMMGQSPLIYRSSAPMCQMNYAEAMEKDGVFGEVAQKAWADASSEWRRYGSENIPSSYKWEDSEEPDYSSSQRRGSRGENRQGDSRAAREDAAGSTREDDRGEESRPHRRPTSCPRYARGASARGNKINWPARRRKPSRSRTTKWPAGFPARPKNATPPKNSPTRPATTSYSHCTSIATAAS